MFPRKMNHNYFVDALEVHVTDTMQLFVSIDK